MGFLTILKLLSIILSGLIGIVASATETRDKRKRINKTGKILLILSSVSLLIGVVAQVTESRESEISSQQSQARLEALARTATNSLASLKMQGLVGQKELSYIERMVGSLDRLSINVQFEFEPMSDVAADFQTRATEHRGEVIQRQLEQMRATLKNNGFTNNVYPSSAIGYVHDESSGETMLVGIDRLGVQAFDDFNLFATNWESDNTSMNKLNSLVESLKSPVFEMRLVSKLTEQSGLSNPDFFTSTEGGKFVDYVNRSNKLLLTWNFECPKTTWRQTMRMTSVADLDNAKMCIIFTNSPYLDGYWLRPREVNLNFGKSILTITDFQFKWFKLNPTTGATNYGYEGILPPPNATQAIP
jgi:hypothetical protein